MSFSLTSLLVTPQRCHSWKHPKYYVTEGKKHFSLWLLVLLCEWLAYHQVLSVKILLQLSWSCDILQWSLTTTLINTQALLHVWQAQIRVVLQEFHNFNESVNSPSICFPPLIPSFAFPCRFYKIEYFQTVLNVLSLCTAHRNLCPSPIWASQYSCQSYRFASALEATVHSHADLPIFLHTHTESFIYFFYHTDTLSNWQHSPDASVCKEHSMNKKRRMKIAGLSELPPRMS